MDKNNFWNEAAKCGAVIGLILAVSSVLENSVFFTSGTGFLYLMLLEFFAVAAVHYYLLHRYTRRRSQLYTADEGFSFGQGYGFLLAVSGFAGIIVGVVQAVYLHLIVGYAVIRIRKRCLRAGKKNFLDWIWKALLPEFSTQKTTALRMWYRMTAR